MNIIQAIILGVLQGIAEFIPVSSSGHLVLVPWLLGWEQPPLVFDTVVHLGTLVAVVAYFWRDWWLVTTAWLRGLIRRDWSDAAARMMWLLILGTVPAAVIGYLFKDFFEGLFGEPVWVSVFLLLTAALLVLAERAHRSAAVPVATRSQELDGLRWRDALAVGFGQAAAIVPGLSRSGVTMSVGLFRGLTRPAAARFSFLLSAPIILGAGLFQLLDLSGEPGAMGQVPILLVGFLTAAASGWLCIRFLLRYLQRGSFYPFAFYCAWLGISCLIVAWLR